MRPIKRGECPKDPSGNKIVFREYGYAKEHLLGRIGDYCSYCERFLSGGLAIEHIRCKDKNPDLECEWDNFLLACPSCNSHKRTTVETEADVDARLWPHRDRTFDVFVYGPGGTVDIAPIDDPALLARAQATEDMVKLRLWPGHGLIEEQIMKASDNRWRVRRSAWDEAIQARDDLQQIDDEAMRRCIINLAKARGCFSIWMTVFRDDEKMLHDLCDLAFQGTAKDRALPLPTHPGASTT